MVIYGLIGNSLYLWKRMRVADGKQEINLEWPYYEEYVAF